MPDHQKIVILDFGGQYTQLIARRVRQAHVYSYVLPYSAGLKEIQALSPRGVIFSGGPASVLDADAPKCDEKIYEMGVPVLGICYGMQLMGHMLGGKVAAAGKREYGLVNVRMNHLCCLFHDTDAENACWMSHTYQVVGLPQGFEPSPARTAAPSPLWRIRQRGCMACSSILKLPTQKMA